MNFKETLKHHPRLSLFYKTLLHVRDRDITLIVYALSFVTLLSFVPFLILTLGVFKTTGFLSFLYPKIELIMVKNFSGVVSVQISKQLQTLLRRSYSGSWGFLNITFLLFTTTRLAAFLEKAINRIWNVKNPKNILKRLVSHWMMIVLVPVALALNVLTRTFFSQWVSGHTIPFILSFLFLTLSLFLLYKWLPNLNVRTSIALFCGILATSSLIVVQKVFEMANSKMFNYSKFYGSLAALPLFLIWISAVWFVILFGASICAGVQKALEQNPHT